MSRSWTPLAALRLGRVATSGREKYNPSRTRLLPTDHATPASSHSRRLDLHPHALADRHRPDPRRLDALSRYGVAHHRPESRRTIHRCGGECESPARVLL